MFDKPKQTIRLIKGQVLWEASYSGHGSDQIKDLFGTTILATAFTANASPDYVLRAIRTLNPEAEVYIDQASR